MYAEAQGLANLKKIQNIKQKVIRQENPVGHPFEALAKIKDSSDKIDKYLLWSVTDGRVSQSKMTAVFRSSKHGKNGDYQSDAERWYSCTCK